jgi:23S rRNA (cytidine1920-2'-O)/16S rRNA (cytidine1409-2'-O)-methyltransferase
VPRETEIEIRSKQRPFSSRAGSKLEYGLEKFNIDVKNKICLDIGASTGGFTDCLLKRGAEFVFAVDVGYGILDHRLRTHSQVGNLEKTNARYLTLDELVAKDTRAENISFVCMDVSFISLITIITPLRSFIKDKSTWVLLFKPQFEVEKNEIKKGGVVKNPEAILNAQKKFEFSMQKLGFVLKAGTEYSPLPGKNSGNVEILYYYEKSL